MMRPVPNDHHQYADHHGGRRAQDQPAPHLVGREQDFAEEDQGKLFRVSHRQVLKA